MAFISDDNMLIDTSYVISVVKGTFMDHLYPTPHQTLEIFLNVGTTIKTEYASELERNRMFDKIKAQLVETNFKVK